MQRSDFLRTTTVAGLGILCVGACATTLLTGCAGAKYVDGTLANGSITVPLSAFVVEGGAAPSVIVRKTGSMQGPIHIIRNADNSYTALSLLCTHKGCVVRAVGTGFECPCHGSEFSAEGAVLSPPAKEPLVRYAVTTDATNVYIKL